MNEMVNAVMEQLKAELYDYAEILSFEEIKTNRKLIRAIERLEEVFADAGMPFRR